VALSPQANYTDWSTAGKKYCVSIYIELFLRSVFRLPVTTNIVPSWPIPVTPMMEAIRSSETLVLTRATRRHILEDDNFHCHSREILKSYIILTGWALQRRCNVSPVRYELGIYIPEDGILHRHRSENLKSYIILTGWAL
jgi:hypothetical protein